MGRNKLGIFLIVLSVLIAGGCAGYGDSEEAGPAEESAEAETEAEAETAEEEMETEAEEGGDSDIIDVEIRNFKYIPEELTVSVGQNVRWTNYDRAIHDVDDGSSIDSQDMGEGDVLPTPSKKQGLMNTYVPSILGWRER